jgi:hypothetical protein
MTLLMQVKKRLSLSLAEELTGMQPRMRGHGRTAEVAIGPSFCGMGGRQLRSGMNYEKIEIEM